MTAPATAPRLIFATRLTLTLAALLLGYAGLVAMLSRQVAHEPEQAALQRLSHSLAAHIIGHWPEITTAHPDPADLAARQSRLQMLMLMVVNPGIQVYLLDAQGAVMGYIGDASMVQIHRVDFQPVRQFLAGAPLPLCGNDPMGSSSTRIFSAAMFPPAAAPSRA